MTVSDIRDLAQANFSRYYNSWRYFRTNLWFLLAGMGLLIIAGIFAVVGVSESGLPRSIMETTVAAGDIRVYNYDGFSSVQQNDKTLPYTNVSDKFAIDRQNLTAQNMTMIFFLLSVFCFSIYLVNYIDAKTKYTIFCIQSWVSNNAVLPSKELLEKFAKTS
jgi:hypothetical protein